MLSRARYNEEGGLLKYGRCSVENLMRILTIMLIKISLKFPCEIFYEKLYDISLIFIKHYQYNTHVWSPKIPCDGCMHKSRIPQSRLFVYQFLTASTWVYVLIHQFKQYLFQ